MKHVQRAVCLIALVAMLLQCGVPALAAGSPSLPAIYWGSVKTNDGSSVTSGEVEAVVDGSVCGFFEIVAGKYGNPPPGQGLKVQGEDGSDLTDKTVRFRVNGVYAKETVVWQSTDLREVNLTVDLKGEPLALQTSTLATGTVGQSYSQSLSASGGTTPYTFAVTAGKLPDGLSLSGSGVITGTPTSAGVVNFTVTVTDKLNTRASQSFSLTINQASVPPGGGGPSSGGGPSAPTTKEPATPISDNTIKDAINRAAQTGKVTVQAPAGESRVALSTNQLKDIQATGKPLETKVNNITMTIGPSVLQVPELRSENTTQVQFSANAVAARDAQEAISQANRVGLFSIASEVFELSASAVLENGSPKNIKQFNGKIQVTLPVPQKARGLGAEGRLTVGYYNEQTKTWQNIGGKYDAVSGTITFETDHFSKYAVMEVNKVKAVVNTSAFSDIANHWASENIAFMAEKGFAGGVGDGRFAPEANITRAQFAAFLVRILAVPESGAALNFTDVKAGDWYYAPLATAYQAGLIKGLTSDKIAPNDNITREQMAVMLVRAMEYKGKTFPDAKGLTFTDKGTVSPWAVAGISQSAQLNLIGGFPNGTFMPQANATRAQAIVMLHRLYNQIQ